MASGSGTVGSKTPAPLSKSEKRWSAALVLSGVVTLVAIVVWFAASTGGGLEVKTTETTKASGSTAEKTTVTEYSDSVLLAGLGISAGLFLAGAFYGRIREIRLPGGVTLGLGDLPEDKRQVVQDTIEEEAAAATQDPAQKKAIKLVALHKAEQRYVTRYAGAPISPPSDSLQQLSSEAVDDAKQALGLS